MSFNNFNERIKSIPYDHIDSPSFIMDKTRLQSNLELLNRVQQEAGVKIILALKAFANWRLFPFIGKYLSGATASSLNEAKLIHEQMGVKAHSYFPVYASDELEQICSLSSHITFNSLSQFERNKSILSKSPDIQIGIRVNP